MQTDGWGIDIQYDICIKRKKERCHTRSLHSFEPTCE